MAAAATSPSPSTMMSMRASPITVITCGNLLLRIQIQPAGVDHHGK